MYCNLKLYQYSTPLRMNKHISKWLVIFFMLVSCSKPLDDYPYENEFIKYIDDTFDLKLIDDRVYYLLPLYSCEPCLSLNINMLANEINGKNVIPILIGNTSEEQWLEMIDKIKSKYPTILEDRDDESRYYELGLGKPLLVHYHSQGGSKYMVVADNKVHLAKAYLNTL